MVYFSLLINIYRISRKPDKLLPASAARFQVGTTRENRGCGQKGNEARKGLENANRRANEAQNAVLMQRIQKIEAKSQVPVVVVVPACINQSYCDQMLIFFRLFSSLESRKLFLGFNSKWPLSGKHESRLWHLRVLWKDAETGSDLGRHRFPPFRMQLMNVVLFVQQRHLDLGGLGLKLVHLDDKVLQGAGGMWSEFGLMRGAKRVVVILSVVICQWFQVRP